MSDDAGPDNRPERNYIERLERDQARLENIICDLNDRVHALEAKVTRLQMFSTDFTGPSPIRRNGAP